jgi:hypothetical protein
MNRLLLFLAVLLAASSAYTKTKPKHYDHGTDESSFWARGTREGNHPTSNSMCQHR